MTNPIMSILLGFILCLSSMTFGVNVSALVTPNEVTVGDVFRFDIRLESDRPFQVTAVPDTQLFDPLELASANAIQDTPTSLTYQFYLRSFSTGALLIPTVTVRTNEDGANRSYVLNSLPINVMSVLPADPSLHKFNDILGLMSVDYNWTLFIVILIVVGLLIGALIFGVMRFLKRRASSLDVGTVHDQRTPKERAFDRLSQLAPASLTSQQLEIAYYTELVMILREFLGAIYGVSLDECTSSEIIAIFESKLEGAQFDRLKRLFDDADVVRFADGRLDEMAHTQNLDRARVIVERVGDG